MYRYDMPTNGDDAEGGAAAEWNGNGDAGGRKTIDGMDVVGSREVTTLNAGFMGNEKPEPVVKEFWYSPRLGINVITKRFCSAGFCGAELCGGNINQAEPDARMFEPPAGYRIVPMDGQ
jgi:hypothetical protein